MFLLTILLISAVFIINGCCNSKETSQNLIKGTITVIGNEPFTKLALKDGENYFALKCSKEFSDKLLKEQGSWYIIEFDKSFTEDGVKYLNVINAVQLKKDSK